LAQPDQEGAIVDMKLELIAVPVTDVDRAKAFYVERAGFNPDHDHTLGEDVRFVQLTPPGSGCSIALGTGITETAPGSAPGITLVVDDIDTARDQLAERGVNITEVQDMPWGARHAHFTDPDGNPWDLQERVQRGA
jgi:catechol 2,3-dioxygenase-like lactoylglutathione lyase family enzyme